MASSTDRRRKLLEGPVGRTLLAMAGPMVLGLAAIILFNVVDTLYVGQLGARPLAAMSFTFPVMFGVMSIAMGLGIGTTSVLARAIGRGDDRQVRRVTTDALALAVLAVTVVGGIGLVLITPLFQLLGATDDLLPLIRAYMVPIFAGIGLLVIPMVGNSALRATGDMVTPSVIMAVVGLVNAILDPLLIFGIGPFPRLELAGAALATVISWGVTFVAAFVVLAFREKMLTAEIPRASEVLTSWRQVLVVGAPAAATQSLGPLSIAVLTRLIAPYGPVAVAAFGVANRLESLAMIGVFALSSAVTPFAGQNYGARRCDRLKEALRFGLLAMLAHGLLMALLLAAGSGVIPAMFSPSADVQRLTAWFLLIVPLSYGPLGFGQYSNNYLNGMGRSLTSAGLIVLRLFAFVLPLAILGSWLFGEVGIFLGLSVGNVLTGVVSYLVLQSGVRRFERAVAADPIPDPAPVEDGAAPAPAA